MSWNVATFESCAALPDIPLSGQHVSAEYYASIWPDQQPTRVLCTTQVFVCTGIALYSLEDGGRHALMHHYSDAPFFSKGRASVENYTDNAWYSLMTQMTSGNTYGAIIFGGHKATTDLKDTEDNRKRAIDYFNMHALHEVLRWSQSLSLEGMINLERARNFVSDKDNEAFGVQMAECVSTWIGDRLFERLKDTPAIKDLTDLRYTAEQTECIIDPTTKTVMVASADTAIRKKIKRGYISGHNYTIPGIKNF